MAKPQSLKIGGCFTIVIEIASQSAVWSQWPTASKQIPLFMLKTWQCVVTVLHSSGTPDLGKVFAFSVAW